MTWAKGDDGMRDNPKILALSDGAFRLWWNANTYANHHLTDGVLLEKNARVLMALQDPGDFGACVSELVTILPGQRNPLWHKRDYGWEIHDFFDHNISRKKVLEQRRIRSESGRKGGRKSGQVRQRKQSAGRDLEAGASPGPRSKTQAGGLNPDPTRPPSSKEGGRGASESGPGPEGAPGRSDLLQVIIDKANAIGCYPIVLNAHAHVNPDRLLELLQDAGDLDGIPTENLIRALREEPGFPVDLLPERLREPGEGRTEKA